MPCMGNSFVLSPYFLLVKGSLAECTVLWGGGVGGGGALFLYLLKVILLIPVFSLVPPFPL